MKSCTITEEQIEELSKKKQAKTKLKEWFPEVFETKLEVGKWYKNLTWEGSLFYFDCKLNEEENSYTSYGFSFKGNWYDVDSKGNWGVDEGYVLATKEEVEQALIKEAERRGFKDVKRNFKDLEGGKNINNLRFHDLEFDIFENWLCDGWGNVIFKNGVWAEIIGDKKEMTIEEIEKQLGYSIKIVKDETK